MLYARQMCDAYHMPYALCVLNAVNAVLNALLLECFTSSFTSSFLVNAVLNAVLLECFSNAKASHISFTHDTSAFALLLE